MPPGVPLGTPGRFGATTPGIAVDDLPSLPAFALGVGGSVPRPSCALGISGAGGGGGGGGGKVGPPAAADNLVGDGAGRLAPIMLMSCSALLMPVVPVAIAAVAAAIVDVVVADRIFVGSDVNGSLASTASISCPVSRVFSLPLARESACT